MNLASELWLISRWPVTHPDLLSISLASDAVVVYRQTGDLTIISPSQVAAVDFQPASG